MQPDFYFKRAVNIYTELKRNQTNLHAQLIRQLAAMTWREYLITASDWSQVSGRAGVELSRHYVIVM